MPRILPINITRPLRNKVCIFPEREVCNLTSSDINSIIRRNPYSFYNIFFKPYIKRLEGQKKYNAIKRQFQKFKRKNILETDENPGYYIYNVIQNENEQAGIVAKIPFEEVINGKIINLEYPTSSNKDEKLALFEQTEFVSKPVNILHDNNEILEYIIEKYKSKIPLFEFTKSDGITYEIWKIAEERDINIIKEVYEQMENFFLADNKSQFDALLELYKKKTHERNFSGTESFNFFPAFLIPKNQVKTYEYKKGIIPDSKIDFNDLLKEIEKDFTITKIDSADIEEQKGIILLYSLQGKYSLKLKKKIDPHFPDSYIFDKYLYPALLKTGNNFSQEALSFCSGDRSLKCVENQLNKGNCKIGFIVYPASVEEIEYLAHSQEKISDNSIYLQPRLLKGLFIYEL
jgi:uncharacterized protein (DUF1015 family)